MKMLALATEIRDLDKENITNLTGLWKLMGIVPNQERNAKGIYRSVNWPHRYWQDWDISATFSERLDNPPLDRKNLVLPEFQISHKENVEYHSDKEVLGLSLKFEQQAMYLNMQDHTPKQQQQLTVSKVTDEKQIHIWCDIASQAFNYQINASSIIRANQRPNVTLLMADIQGQPVATAMLYHSA